MEICGITISLYVSQGFSILMMEVRYRLLVKLFLGGGAAVSMEPSSRDRQEFRNQRFGGPPTDRD